MGRPPLPIHLRAKSVQQRAEALETFFHFCAKQELRLMQSCCQWSDASNISDEDVVSAYREERLGTFFNGRDVQDDLINLEIRR